MATTINSLTALKHALQAGAIITLTVNKGQADDVRIGVPRTVVRADANKVVLRRVRPDGSRVTSDLQWPEAGKIRFTQDGFTIAKATYRIDQSAGEVADLPVGDGIAMEGEEQQEAMTQQQAALYWQHLQQQEAARQASAQRRRNVAIGVGAGAGVGGILTAGATGIGAAILMGLAALFGLFILFCLMFLIFLI
jgi:hypothetical protein